MSEINENYNNSPEGNAMKIQLDRMKELEDKFVVLTYEEFQNLLAVAASASQVLDKPSDRDKAQGRLNEITNIYNKYFYDKEDAIKKINESAGE